MTELSRIADSVGTDKGPNWHGFTDFYEKNLGHLRERKNLSILELGVFKGSSLEMWYRFFGEEAKIFGVDINPLGDLPVFSHKNVKFIQADQCSEQQLLDVVLQSGEKAFDLIIDDGAHTPLSQLTSLKVLSNFVKPEGFYVLEDLHTSFWSDYTTNYNFSALKFITEGSVEGMDLSKVRNRIETVTVFNRTPYIQHVTAILTFKKSLV